MALDYVRQSLTEDEELVHVAHFHWMYTLGAVLNIVFGVGLAIALIVGSIAVQPMLPNFFKFDVPPDAGWIEMVRAVHPGIKIIAFLVLAMGLLRYAHMMIIKATTEIAITNKRLIYKRGLIARYVGEMNIDRIEGYVAGMDFAAFAVDQRTIDAVERCLLRLSEAVIKIGVERMAEISPTLPVDAVRGLGNLLRHDYDQVDLEIIWRTVRDSLPRLGRDCRLAVELTISRRHPRSP